MVPLFSESRNYAIRAEHMCEERACVEGIKNRNKSRQFIRPGLYSAGTQIFGLNAAGGWFVTCDEGASCLNIT